MSKKSKLALAAKKCHPIKSYFATTIPTTPDDSGHPTPNRNLSDAWHSRPRVARDDADDNAPNRNPEVFVDDDDLKPPAVLPTAPRSAKTIPLPLEWTQLGKSPTDSFDAVKIKEVKWGMRICNCSCQEIADPTTSVLFC